MGKQVGIVGAGVSGLLACKYVSEIGFNPIVFEAKNSVGGVWTQTIQTTKLQNFKQDYQFSDFPWSSTVKEDFPDHNQVMEYIESYARHFNLLQFVKFNSPVKSIDYEGTTDEEMDSWDLWSGNGDPFGSKGKWNITVEDWRTQSSKTLYFSKFSDVPNIPDFPPEKGPECFKGKVIHSMDYSAMDDATAANFIKGKRVTIITPNNFYDRVEEGSIIPKKSTTFSFWENGLILRDENTVLETDIVISATGFKGDQKLQNIFASQTFQKHMKNSVSLYRDCVHPRIPQLAVIGYSESFLNVFTSEMRSRWLAHLLKENIVLPRMKEMEADVLRWERYMEAILY